MSLTNGLIRYGLACAMVGWATVGEGAYYWKSAEQSGSWTDAACWLTDGGACCRGSAGCTRWCAGRCGRWRLHVGCPRGGLPSGDSRRFGDIDARHKLHDDCRVDGHRRLGDAGSERDESGDGHDHCPSGRDVDRRGYGGKYLVCPGRQGLVPGLRSGDGRPDEDLPRRQGGELLREADCGRRRDRKWTVARCRG